jgi:hypothetical protein
MVQYRNLLPVLEDVIRLFPDRRFVRCILVVMDSGSLIERSNCSILSTASRPCRYKLAGLLENKGDLNSQLGTMTD